MQILRNITVAAYITIFGSSLMSMITPPQTPAFTTIQVQPKRPTETGLNTIALAPIVQQQSPSTVQEKTTAENYSRHQHRPNQQARRRCNPALFTFFMFIPVITFFISNSLRSNTPQPPSYTPQPTLPIPQPSPTPQPVRCTFSTQPCLDTNSTIDLQDMCWDAQITINANTTNSTSVLRNCLCPVAGIDNSTALTEWALTNLMTPNHNSTHGNSSAAFCIRPNLKPCSATNYCSDPRQALLQLKNLKHNSSSYIEKKKKHRFKYPQNLRNKRTK